MKNRLISAPSIFCVAQPALTTDGIHSFIEAEGLSVVADNPATPLHRLANQSYDYQKGIDYHDDGEALVEFAGRQCYAAYEKGRSPDAYIENILKMAHGSVLQHANWSFAFTGISRSLTLELNRHGAGTAISQESQRFVDASQVKFVVPPALLHLWGNDLECEDAKDFLRDNVQQVHAYNRWQAEVQAMEDDYEAHPLEPYFDQVATYTDAADLREKADVKRRTMIQKRANETARAVLPNACETKMVWTANARALRYILSLRGAHDADLEIRRFAAQLAIHCKLISPRIFADIDIVPGDFSVPVVTAKYDKV